MPLAEKNDIIRIASEKQDLHIWDIKTNIEYEINRAIQICAHMTKMIRTLMCTTTYNDLKF